jgi:outer membrane protein assembly factor BamD
MHVPLPLRHTLVVLLALSGAACNRNGFNVARFRSNGELFQASLRQFQQRRWGNAVSGFERLTLELPARDTLFARALWYLGRAHRQRDEHLLAAQTFTRLAESFPNDTLADDALVEAGISYARMWRRPTLDPQYGESALQTLRTMLAVYPSSPEAPRAQREIERLLDRFAQKDFNTGMHYFRRKAYDSSLIYFRDVLEKYPDTPTARRAQLQMVEAFRRIEYREDVAETCASLHQRYPGDGAVREACGPPTAAAADSAGVTP